ncbi:hypothetical protein GCM10009795_004650 [Nocardioides hankookensis]|uniref:Uncharacterized protein n=1 Tax=Nocardioides hankookensis TaxID=443157 RepID=A0ABW1LLD5_9ACTN
MEWDAADLLTPDGLRVEVKSAAYLQTWAQTRPSRITFGIRPTTGWDAATNSLSETRMRQSDVYVFALLHHQNKSTVDPLDLDQWTFHAMSTLKLNKYVPEQRSIGLASLMGLEPEVAQFEGLPAAVSRAFAYVGEH